MAGSHLVTELAITHGLCRIDKIDMARRPEFTFELQQWAKGLGARRGPFDVERIVHRMDRDNAVAGVALVAGESELREECGARSRVRPHEGEKRDDGRIVRNCGSSSPPARRCGGCRSTRRGYSDFNSLATSSWLGYLRPSFSRRSSSWRASPFCSDCR